MSREELLLRQYRRIAKFPAQIESVEAADRVWTILEEGRPGRERITLCAFQFRREGSECEVAAILNGALDPGPEYLRALEEFCRADEIYNGAVDALKERRKAVAVARRDRATEKLREAEKSGREEGRAEATKTDQKSASAPKDWIIPPLDEQLVKGIADGTVLKSHFAERNHVTPARLEAYLVMTERWQVAAENAQRLVGLGKKGAQQLVTAVNAKFGFQGSDLGNRVRKARFPVHWKEALNEVIEAWLRTPGSRAAA